MTIPTLSRPGAARRDALRAALALCVAGGARAQSAPWPNRPVRIVAPGAAGGIFDLTARQLAERLSPALGQPVVVDNRVGAGGLIAMQHVARSPADGYTFAVATFTQLAVNPWMFDKPAYDPVADFAPVTALFESQILLVARPDAPCATFRDVLDAARARPGRVSYGSSGIGQPPHVLMELMRHRLGIDLLHVPYKGGPAAVAGLLAGDVDLVFEGAAGLVPQVRAGRLRALAATGVPRVAALPEVPTLHELGVPGIDNSWMGLVAPAGTPAPIVERVHAEVARLVEQPDFRASWESAGRIPIASSPQAFGAMIRDVAPKWRELVRVAGLKPE